MRPLKKKGENNPLAGVRANVGLHMSPFHLNAFIFSPNPHLENKVLAFFFAPACRQSA